MSIFKETFPDYVYNQLQIRKETLRSGDSASLGRFSKQRIAYSGSRGGGITQEVINLDERAFFTYTTEKQCVIKMSSGVDLTYDDLSALGNEIYENQFEKEKYSGNGLAKNYVLYGYAQRIPKEEVGVGSQFPGTNLSLPSVFTDFVQKSGIGSQDNAAYGSSLLRADAKDGFGIVPAPGITDMTIQTKTAYGSLRTANVNFECHNRRQLEVLELLYMRPGYPVLIEWSWSPYVDNSGRRQPFPVQFPDDIFYDKNSSFDTINKFIFDLKKISSGNYDGFLGFVKNFKYEARPDGGYKCMTEIIGMGECLTELKGKQESADGKQRYAVSYEEFIQNALGVSREGEYNTENFSSWMNGAHGNNQGIRPSVNSNQDSYGIYGDFTIEGAQAGPLAEGEGGVVVTKDMQYVLTNSCGYSVGSTIVRNDVIFYPQGMDVNTTNLDELQMMYATIPGMAENIFNNQEGSVQYTDAPQLQYFVYGLIPNPSLVSALSDEQLTEALSDSSDFNQLGVNEGALPFYIQVPLLPTDTAGNQLGGLDQFDADEAGELTYTFPTPNWLYHNGYIDWSMLHSAYSESERDLPVPGGKMVLPEYHELLKNTHSYLTEGGEGGRNLNELLISSGRVRPVDNLELYLVAMLDNDRIKMSAGDFKNYNNKALLKGQNTQEYESNQILNQKDYEDLFILLLNITEKNKVNFNKFLQSEEKRLKDIKIPSENDRSKNEPIHVRGLSGEGDHRTKQRLSALWYILFNVLIYSTEARGPKNKRYELLNNKNVDDDQFYYGAFEKNTDLYQRYANDLYKNGTGFDVEIDAELTIDYYETTVSELQRQRMNNLIMTQAQQQGKESKERFDKQFASDGDRIRTYGKGGLVGEYINVDANFVRWDFLCEIINWAAINEYKNTDDNGFKNKKLIELSYIKDELDSKSGQDMYLEYANVYYKDINQASGESDKTQEFDKSLDPTICLFPNQMDIQLKNKTGFYWENFSQKERKFNKKYSDAVAVQEIKNGHVKAKNATMYPLRGNLGVGNKHNYIGFIYLNLKHITAKYKELKENGDFTLFKWIKAIWDDVNRATGFQHNFQLQTIHEESNKVRIIDALYENSQNNAKNSELFRFDIQGKNSIVRNFKFNTTIPSSLTATIAIAAQAGDTMEDINQVSFAAFNRNIKSRFTQVIHNEANLLEKYNNRKKQLKENIAGLFTYLNEIENGFGWYDTQEGTNENESKKTSRTNASSTLSSIIRSATVINATDPNTGKLLDGHKIKLSKSAIIPLSFDCVLDGISGIVIGNIFKINKEYLPKAYQADNIAFIVTSEKQKVTVGQDWTTTIGGQLIIKDDTYEATEAVEIIEEIKSNSKEETNLNKIDDDEEKKGDLINPTQDSKNFIDANNIQYQGQGYPQRPSGKTHNGIDLPMNVGTPFRAMADGTVEEGFQKGYKQLKAADGTSLWNLKKGIKPSGGSTKTTKNIYGEKRYCAHHVDTGPSDTYHNNLDDFEKITKKGRSYGMYDIIWEQGFPVPAVDTASQTENPRGWGAGLYLTLTLDKEVSVAGGHTLKFVRMFHCSEIVKTGPVKQGDIIAKSGGKVGEIGSGNSTGPHLHFETADGSGKKKGRFHPKYAIRYPYLVKYKTFSSFGENDNLKTDEERAASGQQ